MTRLFAKAWLFESAGYAAESFASAEDYLRREMFDGPVCLVLDLRMAGLNGLGLQEAIASRAAREQIVFITGHGDCAMRVTIARRRAIDRVRRRAAYSRAKDRFVVYVDTEPRSWMQIRTQEDNAATDIRQFPRARDEQSPGFPAARR